MYYECEMEFLNIIDQLAVIQYLDGEHMSYL